MDLMAVIDVGSNTVRLLVGEARGGKVFPLRYERRITRLAGGMDPGGMLDPDAQRLTIDAISAFCEIARSLCAGRIKAVATSALREAAATGERSSEGFVREVKGTLGIDVEILSGQEEAWLMAAGALSSLDTEGQVFVLDIGGGSLEWVLAEQGTVVFFGSELAGVVRLLEKHIRSDPPTGEEMSSLMSEAGMVATKVLKRIRGRMAPGLLFVATAGTATTIASLDLGLEIYDRDKVHGHVMEIDRVRGLAKGLNCLALKDRRELKGLEPGREDLIIPGIHLTIKLMEVLGVKSLRVSDQGLLEGALLAFAADDRASADRASGGWTSEGRGGATSVS